MYKFQVSSINLVGESVLSDEVEIIVKSLPSRPLAPVRTGSVIDSGTASISVAWYKEEMYDTGGVPLTGFKLYYIDGADEDTIFDSASATLAFDGTDQPEVRSFTTTGLATG